MTATASVLVCRGCCCGTDDVERAEDQVATLRDAVSELPKGRVTLTNCLGPCSERDIVAVRHRDTDRPGRPLATTWFRHVDDAAIAALCKWVATGADGDVPHRLQIHLFDADDHDVTADDAITTSDRVR